MATGLKRALRLSGSSVRPAQPGFMVMNTEKVGLILISEPSNLISWAPSDLALKRTQSCQAMTDKTSRLILLNSSKQHQAPDEASPLKNFPTNWQSIDSQQLKTTHCLARALARSLVVSVLPVPAGPAGAPPRLSLSALMRVMQHLSVRGVITSLLELPRYSQPQGNLVWRQETIQEESSRQYLN